MLAVRGEHAQIAAVLHDVVEDTTVTLADLRAAGFAEAVLNAVAALTKFPGNPDSRQRNARPPIRLRSRSSWPMSATTWT